MPQTLRTECEPGGQWLWALLKRAGAPPSQTQPPAKNRVERTGDCVPVAGPGVVGPRWPGCAGLRVGGPCQEPRSRARVFWSSSLGPTARGGGPGTEATGTPKPCPRGQPHRGLWPAAAATHGQAEVALWGMAVCLSVTAVAWDLGKLLARPQATAGGGQAPGWVGPGFSSHICAFLWGSNPPRTLVLSAEGFFRLPWAPASGQSWLWLFNLLRPRGLWETSLTFPECVIFLQAMGYGGGRGGVCTPGPSELRCAPSFNGI